MSNIPFHCPHCDHSLEAPFEMLGQLIECPSCGETIEVQKQAPRPPLAPSVPPRVVPKLKMPPPPKNLGKPTRGKEYKVLTPKDKWFAGEFSPEKLEQALNAYAAQGWRVVSVATASIPAVPGGPREDLIVVMGRDK